MYKIFIVVFITVLISEGCNRQSPQGKTYAGLPDDMFISQKDTILADSIIYHTVRIDHKGAILPWYSTNLGESYDYVLHKVYDFWKNMALDTNGAEYYMNHQVWRPDHDKRGIGGDQVMMTLSSWDLYYNYTGDESVIDNMKYVADYYLAHSLSAPNSAWPDLPYPYNNKVESGIYDGDMILGKGFLQPDKAGSFGFELVHLYKKTGDRKYLDAAIKIANTMAAKVQPGDNDNSPWPFKVNAENGEPGLIVDKVVWYEGMSKDIRKTKLKYKKSSYTTNWTATLNLFSELINLHQGKTDTYKKAFDMTLNWLKTYPAKTNKWGPFFEDVPRWSDTQINAITYAMYLLGHEELDDRQYAKYGVTCTDEQTAYRVPGNSHSSREGSVELMYWEKTGDTAYARNAIRELNWATYMVDSVGKNFYPTNDIWMTDGYGDYVRHYLRAMAAAPQLAPENSDHLLNTSSIIKKILYGKESISYNVFDSASIETLRLLKKPGEISVQGNILAENDSSAAEGWQWEMLGKGGILKIKHEHGNEIDIRK